MNEDYLRLKNYVTQNATFTCRDREWIFWREDLITVAPSRDNTWLDAIVRKIPHKFPCRLMRVSCTAILVSTADISIVYILYYSSSNSHRMKICMHADLSMN